MLTFEVVHDRFQIALDGAVSGYVRAHGVSVAVAAHPQLIQLSIEHFIAVGMTTQNARVRLTDRLTVPACTLRVQRGKHLLIGFGGPFKGRRELGFINFVIMVDEGFRLGNGEDVVLLSGELVCMPIIKSALALGS